MSMPESLVQQTFDERHYPVCQGILGFENPEFSASRWSFYTSVQIGMRTVLNLSKPHSGNEQRSDSVWPSPPQEQMMSAFSSLFNHLDPRIEVAYLHSIWCTFHLDESWFGCILFFSFLLSKTSFHFCFVQA